MDVIKYVIHIYLQILYILKNVQQIALMVLLILLVLEHIDVIVQEIMVNMLVHIKQTIYATAIPYVVIIVYQRIVLEVDVYADIQMHIQKLAMPV
ncbi:MAG: hypothetical protein EBY81_08095 [Verrucomicrobia bacterium]|nr:hypothetical protein [Verrucomicrobiota bacterium]